MIPLQDDNPTELTPVVTVTFIVLCVLVFFYQASLAPPHAEAIVFQYGAIPALLFGRADLPSSIAIDFPAYATLLTSMFMHGGWMHLIGNMLYLWIFGNNIEDATGRLRFIVFYLLCGILAAYAHAYLNRSSPTPMIGASGAVSGVLGAYLLLYPRARVVTLVFFGFYIRTIEVPAMLVLGFWFVLQFLNALVAPGAAGGVAWYAHVSGFLSGVVLIGLFKRRRVPLFRGGRGFSIV
jgi:membrane associated rhomboid family serine protease